MKRKKTKSMSSSDRNEFIVDEYYKQMKNGTFNPSERPVAGYKYNSEFYITDGHHRMAAAYRLYYETGNADFINQLINAGFASGGIQENNPFNYGYYKTSLFK